MLGAGVVGAGVVGAGVVGAGVVGGTGGASSFHRLRSRGLKR